MRPDARPTETEDSLQAIPFDDRKDKAQGGQTEECPPGWSKGESEPGRKYLRDR